MNSKKVIGAIESKNLKKTPDVCAKTKKSSHDWLAQWHERQVKLALMPFWSFNFKKYL